MARGRTPVSCFRVSARGQMALPADARRRWELVDGGARLSLLALEALAAAEHLGAELCLASPDDNPALRDAASRRGVATRTID